MSRRKFLLPVITVLLLLLLFSLQMYGEVGMVRGVAAAFVSSPTGRSPLQKWLHADWTQKHEVPFDWFIHQRHSAHNKSFHASTANTAFQVRRHLPITHTAGPAEGGEWQFSASDGHYVVVKLDKLSREHRRAARRILAEHGMRDTHVIDELHLLVYVDTPRASLFRAAFEADADSAVQLSSMTVMDIYSTLAGARLKLSRAIRIAMDRCNLSSRRIREFSSRDEMTPASLRYRRLPLDVRTALGMENVVETSLRNERIVDAAAATGCQWEVLSATSGKGLVRWVLSLSPKENERANAKENSNRDEEMVLCRCASFISVVIEQPAVRWMEVAAEYAVPLNDHATALVQQGRQNEKAPAHPFWDMGIDGTGEIIGMADSGIDYDSCFFNDPKEEVAIYPKVNHNHRKIVSYAPCDLIPGDYYIGDKAGGHGTHVAGSAAGHMLGGGANAKYDGVAKGAKLFFKGLGCPSQSMLTLPVDITDVFRPGYDAGARVFTNSWGFFAPPEYTAVEKSIDAFAGIKEDSVLIFASGNDPRSGLMIPCRAKNMICIGAHMNSFDPKRENIIGTFSSFGPTYDKRVKPELLGPGKPITSALSDGDVHTKQCSVTSKWGTSMATAVVAGGVTLMRHHLRLLKNTTTPSSALLKAMMIHSTVYLNNSRMGGFGRLDLSVFFAPHDVKGWFRDRETVMHHTNNVYCFTAAPTATEESDEVRVTLAWTDVGSAIEGSTRSLVNDLDLMVVDSAGAVYYAGEDGLDSVNVLEQLRLPPSPSLAAGFRVFVYGGDVHDGMVQKYALVVSGPGLQYVENCSAVSNTSCAKGCSGNGQCVEGVCKCTAGYRFVDCSFCDEDLRCHGHGTCETKDLKCKCDNDHFATENCSMCKDGWYGPSCSSNCTCSNRGTCNKSTGECTCPKVEKWGGTGCYSGPNCEYCCKDFYGDNCSLRSYWCREDGWPVAVNDTRGGYIQINGYGTYSPMLTCRWDIDAPKGRRVRLEYLEFDLEEPTDVLLVYDVIGNDTSPLRTDSGKRANGTVVYSSQNALSIAFASGWSHIRHGFLLRYSFEKILNPACMLNCTENALCEEWDGGFCLCDSGQAGWMCDTKMELNKDPIKLAASDTQGATNATFLINGQTWLLLRRSPSVVTDASLYLAFANDFIATQHHGIVLQVMVTTTNPKEDKNTTIMVNMTVTQICKYPTVGLNHALQNVDGTLNISLRLLHNASSLFDVNNSANQNVSLYVAEGEPFVGRPSENAADINGRLLYMYCSSALPIDSSSKVPTTPPIVYPTDTTPTSVPDAEPTNITEPAADRPLGFIAGPGMLVLLTVSIAGVCIVVNCTRWGAENYELGAIPPEEVLVSAASFRDEGGVDYDDDGGELFSSLTVTPRLAAEDGTSRDALMQRRKGNTAYMQIQTDDSDAEVEMTRKSKGHQGEEEE
ncbi:subtilisin-like serine peptidase [Trypanosoma grayi]|uniref:subtilisin-like serine peptidase n=1 Tax=Trypanosoma grayi TaxID=71804 RepID=UPI0004F4046A|nr:subtilisin-like serine peptidase [Trypanosoma grayi]KEG13817.1 subtilisin-like serine peptidase [Trypanosoma grayi]